MEISTSCVHYLTITLTIFLLHHLCNSIDTISSTQFISDSKNESLISSDGNFKLGFFSPKNSQNRYVGIWFNKIPQFTVVWVANRDVPLNNHHGIFKITGYGNAAVFSGTGETEPPLWSSNVTVGLIVSSTAKLFVFRKFGFEYENRSGHEVVLWQSFNYPTDTVLPGMRFGLDQRTGVNWVLSSWRSELDPSSGDFTFGVEQRGSPQFLLYKMSAPYWRGGPWTGRTLSGVPVVKKRLKTREVDYSGDIVLFDYVFTNNNDEISISFGVPNASVFSTLVLHPLGTVARQIWLPDNNEWVQFWVAPEDRCDEYSRCGPSSICNSYKPMQCTCLPGFEPQFPQDWYYRKRCVEKKKPHTCGKGNGEGFIKMPELKLPDAKRASVYANLSLQECEVECLKSCDCTGYASANVSVGGVGCFIWHGVLDDMRVYVQDEQDFYIRVDATVLAANVQKKVEGFGGLKRTLTVTILPVVLGVILFIACSCYFRRKRNKKIEKQKYQEMLLLDSATNMDSPNAKNSEKSTNIELKFFDLDIIKTATHNFCPVKKLREGGYGPVYKGELPNGQEIAVKRLSKNSGQGVIEFKNEALLIAKLQHRNLVRLLGCCIEDEEKMLIYEYMPNKSLDYFIFGNQDEANTNKVVGTFGYMSPEYALDGLFSVKSNVFSFGVLLLEIISGTKNMGFFHVDPSSNLIRHAWQLWTEGRALEIVDASMGDSGPTNEVLRCIQVELLCVQDNAAERPTTSSINFMLSNEATLPSPMQPMFTVQRNQNNADSTTTKSIASINEVTVTILEAR